jgi:assimilatory nitrate reductase catalytic subunit
MARTCDLFLPVKPGRDTALFNGILQLMIENGWLDRAFIDQHTVGFDAVAQAVKEWTPRRTAEVTGIAEKSIRTAAEWWGKAKTSFLLHARGLEHHSNGVMNVLSTINIVLGSGRLGRKGCGYGTITGQANGQGGREHGQKSDQLPGGRDLENPQHREEVAKIWGISADELPRAGVDAYELMRKAHRGEVKGLLSICFNPVVSLPDNNFVREALEKLEFYVAIDFFLSESARYADIVLPGSLQEEDEGTITQVEGRIIKINPAVSPPGDAKQDWRIIQDIAKAVGRERGLSFQDPREIFEELRVATRGAVIDYSGVTWERVVENFGVFWPCPSEVPEGVPLPGPQGTPRLFEPGSWNPVARGKGPFYFPDGKARFNVTPYKGAGRGRRRGLPHHPHDRARGESVPLRQPDAPHRPAGRSLPGAEARAAPEARREAGNRRRGLGHRGESPGHLHPARGGGRNDPSGHRLHPVPLGRPEEREPAHHLRAGSDLEDP